MSYTVFIYCKSLDDARKALGLFMSHDLKHRKTHKQDDVCPHCGETIYAPQDIFFMSAETKYINEAVELVAEALQMRLHAGAQHNNKE